MAEQLLRLKDSDPELFSQAWKKLPQSTQDNIIAYLKKHGAGDQTSSSRHSTFEDKASHTKHKGTDRPQPERLEHRGHNKSQLTTPPLLETRKAGHSGRPLYEWTDGELLAHTLLDSETKENTTESGTSDRDLAQQLKHISRQNTVQIVQNELIRRLLQTIAGNS